MRPLTDRSMASPEASPKISAVSGAIRAALPQTCFVSGLGNSCSQPLLAYDPSHTDGSGANTTSIPADAAGVAGSGLQAGQRATATVAAADPSTTPSSRDR